MCQVKGITAELCGREFSKSSGSRLSEELERAGGEQSDRFLHIERLGGQLLLDPRLTWG